MKNVFLFSCLLKAKKESYVFKLFHLHFGNEFKYILRTKRECVAVYVDEARTEGCRVWSDGKDLRRSNGQNCFVFLSLVLNFKKVEVGRSLTSLSFDYFFLKTFLRRGEDANQIRQKKKKNPTTLDTFSCFVRPVNCFSYLFRVCFHCEDPHHHLP